MKIALVTDEVSADPETAIELGVAWGTTDFELRGFGENRVPNLTDFQKARILELMEKFKVDVIAISPGLFKIPFPAKSREHFPLRTFDASLYGQWRSAQDLVKYHLDDLLPRSIAYAREVGTSIIIAFSFHRGDHPAGRAPDEVVEALKQAAAQVGEAGLELAIEVEADYWADTGVATAQLIQDINHPAINVNWDPGNAFVAGDHPFPEGYAAVKHLIRHVHFKDVVREPDGGFRYAIEGHIDWAGQIKALLQDGYEGYISVETHMEPKVQSARALTQRLRKLISDSSSDN